MTWAYSPTCPYSPAQEDLTSAQKSSEDSAPSAMLSMIHTPKASSCPESETAGSTTHLSGTMSRHLTGDHGVDSWMSSLAASRAKICPSPESGKESSKEIEVGYGSSLPGSYAKWDRGSSSWKTYQGSLLGGLESFSETWPRWGLMRSGKCYQPQRSELPICESESGLWATPLAADAIGSHGGGQRRSLRTDIWKWKHGQFSGPANWPTPNVCGLYNKKGASKKSGDGLASAVKRFPTPMASDGERGIRTPARAARERARRRHVQDLPTAVGGALNPMWVELLMGWPKNWTVIDETTRRWLDALRKLRSKAGTKKIRKTFGGQANISSQTTLQPDMREQSQDFKAEKLPLESEKISEGSVRGLRIDKENTCPSCGSEPNEQRSEEPADALHSLPSFLAQDDRANRQEAFENAWSPGWEDGVTRVAHGVAFRAHRLRCLGNGVVPQQAAPAWERIKKIHEARIR